MVEGLKSQLDQARGDRAKERQGRPAGCDHGGGDGRCNGPVGNDPLNGAEDLVSRLLGGAGPPRGRGDETGPRTSSPVRRLARGLLAGGGTVVPLRTVAGRATPRTTIHYCRRGRQHPEGNGRRRGVGGTSAAPSISFVYLIHY